MDQKSSVHFVTYELCVLFLLGHRSRPSRPKKTKHNAPIHVPATGPEEKEANGQFERLHSLAQK